MKICHCGVYSRKTVVHTDENLGRGFYGYGNFERLGQRCCEFFEWTDEDDTKRRISNTILKQLEVKEKEVMKLERKIARMKIEIRSLNRTKNVLIYL